MHIHYCHKSHESMSSLAVWLQAPCYNRAVLLRYNYGATVGKSQQRCASGERVAIHFCQTSLNPRHICQPNAPNSPPHLFIFNYSSIFICPHFFLFPSNLFHLFLTRQQYSIQFYIIVIFGKL